MKKIAIFDFDGTITKKDSFVAFCKFSRGNFQFTKAILHSSPILFAWKCGLVSGGQAKQYLFSQLFKGMPIECFNSLGKAFATNINNMLRPDIIKILKNHIETGTECYIISASLETWILPWARQNGIINVGATQVEVDEKGFLTGRFSTPNCIGYEKIHKLEELIPEYKNCEVWAYGDSKSDIPLLNIVQHGIKV